MKAAAGLDGCDAAAQAGSQERVQLHRPPPQWVIHLPLKIQLPPNLLEFRFPSVWALRPNPPHFAAREMEQQTTEPEQQKT
jgi:hypothetical protein